MKKGIALVMVIYCWVSLIIKLKIRIELNTGVSIFESVLQFLSYFTILTNILVAVYFTAILFNKKKNSIFNKPGTLTAIAAFIAFVGVIYHLLLRSVWDPQGIVKFLDETHHTVIPLITIVFWITYENLQMLKFKKFMIWILYPLLYLVWVILRGVFASFYPYYFIDASQIGMQQVLINSVGLLVVLGLFLVVFYFIAKKMKSKKAQVSS